jgi:4-hydroxyphenylpyruvate dioxygenase
MVSKVCNKKRRTDPYAGAFMPSTSQMTQGRQGTKVENPIGLDGMEFIEYTSADPQALEKLFRQMGFEKTGSHKKKNVSLFSQNRIHFILNNEKKSFADQFSKSHGPAICSTGFRVKNAQKAFDEAVKRGAKPCPPSQDHSFLAVYGIGESLIYFVDQYSAAEPYKTYEEDFNLETHELVPGHGLLVIDHLTNNVPKGDMQKWCDFYSQIFGFTEVRYFNIKGKATGLYSKVMRSPCGKIMIPINEPLGEKSQIQEYLEEYHGSGIQHVALLTTDIEKSLRNLLKAKIEFLNTTSTYYDLLPKRLPNVTEDMDTLRDLNILADGDEEGYLLQIFSKNVIGPIFYELIQRKNHAGFGEGNFQALFDAIEEDQRKRGYL